MITAAGIRAAIARLVDSGNPATMRNVANELHVKTIELEPLVHQMFRDGQLDPRLTRSTNRNRRPAPAHVSGATRRRSTPAEPAGRTLVSPHPGSGSGAVSRPSTRTSSDGPSTGRDTDRPSFRDGTGHVAGAWVTDPGAVGHRRSAALHLRRHHRHDRPSSSRTMAARSSTPPLRRRTLLLATFRDPAGNVLGLRQEVTPPEDPKRAGHDGKRSRSHVGPTTSAPRTTYPFGETAVRGRRGRRARRGRRRGPRACRLPVPAHGRPPRRPRFPRRRPSSPAPPTPARPVGRATLPRRPVAHACDEVPRSTGSVTPPPGGPRTDDVRGIDEQHRPSLARSGAHPRMRSDAFSAIMTVEAWVWPRGIVGMTDASTTRSRSRPWTRRSASTTASSPLPIMHVPTGW